MRNKHITKWWKNRASMFLALALLAGMIVLNMTVKEPELEPDVVHPMANANVTWLETYHSGGWAE